jgi:HD-GYP domain-containing protein (c-di-GMP phosphodiesterase class II)
MKIDSSVNTFLMFIAILLMLVTGYYVGMISVNNNVTSEYTRDVSLMGSRLSDKVYATISNLSERESAGAYIAEYEYMIYNISNNGMSNWKVCLEVPKNTVVEGTWNVNFTDSDGNFYYFTPEYYNSNFDSYEAIQFGITLKTKEPFKPSNIRFTGYEISKGTQQIIRQIMVICIATWAICFVGFLVTKFNLKNYKEKQKNDVKIILQSMNTFISFIDAKDPYTRGHSKRVAMYAAEIGKRIGLSTDEIQNIYYAGLLHDSGKISVPDAVLNKPGKLTDDERKLIQNHTIAGEKMLRQLSSIRGIRETALYHHERYDGTGYPEGLSGNQIPLYARIVGVADSYDAMSSNRVYRRHLGKDEIIEEIQRGSGTQFDPDIVKIMVDMINDGYVNVVKVETADNDGDNADFHLTESDIPGVYMGY